MSLYPMGATEELYDRRFHSDEEVERYGLLLDGKQDEADAGLAGLVMGLLEDFCIPYDEDSVYRMCRVEGLFPDGKYVDSGRVREAIEKLTDTPCFEAWIEARAAEERDR
jgi:hypothetical protein